MGAGLGAVTRYWIGVMTPTSFPWATVLVNVVGSFLAGLLIAGLSRHPDPEPWRLLLVVGVLGGFTTFSAFSWDALKLMQESKWMEAAGYVFGSVLLGLVACFLGFSLWQRVAV